MAKIDFNKFNDKHEILKDLYTDTSKNLIDNYVTNLAELEKYIVDSLTIVGYDDNNIHSTIEGCVVEYIAMSNLAKEIKCPPICKALVKKYNIQFTDLSNFFNTFSKELNNYDMFIEACIIYYVLYYKVVTNIGDVFYNKEDYKKAVIKYKLPLGELIKKVKGV